MPKIKHLLTAIIALIGTMIFSPFFNNTDAMAAENCPDVEIIFVRGSGGTRWVDDNYQAFLKPIEEKLEKTDISYKFEDLDYPAVGVGFLNWADVITTLGAYFGGGETYQFGDSVNKGVSALIKEVNQNKCTEAKFVIGGYSQGAMVISKALSSLNSDKVIYAATFGDPKIYLPEGKATLAANMPGTSDKNGLRTGAIPAACKGENLSNYRMYVPDCYAYEGLLGSYRPYQPEAYIDKLGTWCNKLDVFCSSYYSVTDHVSYIDDGLYDDASKTIFAQILAEFNSDYEYISVHNTAILIDSTSSMLPMINKYRSEALRIAKKTFEAGGKVALYDYRDEKEGYLPVERCSFETCTPENFEQKLNAIVVSGGGDWPESALTASWRVMNKLNWEKGATKSLIILTDAPYHDSEKIIDVDGFERVITRSDVVNLSYEIDPVNFYIVTNSSTTTYYESLAKDTDGRAGVLGEDEIEITNQIMSRYDSLPKVGILNELTATTILEATPWIEVSGTEDSLGSAVTLRLGGKYTKVLVAVNDAVLGVTEGDTVTIGELDRSVVNSVTLVPLSETRRGESVTVELGTVAATTVDVPIIPKAPNTGRL